jgi:hypothetical protein
MALHGLTRLAESIENYQKALELDPTNAQLQ